MKTKFIVLSLIVAGICTMSCRQDNENENSAEEIFQQSLKENSTEEFQKNFNDSIVIENTETEPPKTGTHWKVDEITGTQKSDSLSLNIEFGVENGTGDTPKTGTHWKEK